MDNKWKDNNRAICNHHSYNFTYGIIEGGKPIVYQLIRILNFRNECNKVVFEHTREFCMFYEVVNCFKKLIPNNTLPMGE